MSRIQRYHTDARSKVNGKRFGVRTHPTWIDIDMPANQSLSEMRGHSGRIDGWELDVKRRLTWPFYDAFRLRYWRWIPDSKLPDRDDRKEAHQKLVATVENDPPATWQMSPSAIRLAKGEASMLRAKAGRGPG